MEVLMTMFMMVSIVGIIHTISSFPFIITFALSFIMSSLLTYSSVVNKAFVPLEPFIEFFIPKDKVVEDSETANKENLARDNFDDAITKKFRELTGHIIRDFILDWYNTVSHDVEFVQQMFELFEHFFTQLRERVSRVDPSLFARLILLRLLRHHKSYKRALQMVRDRGVRNDGEEEEEMVVAYEKLNGHLAMSNLPDSENDHHRALVVAVLKALLPPDYRLLGTALYLVRELIARNCVLDLVSMSSDPEWLNRAVVDLLGEGTSTCDDTDHDDDDAHQVRTSTGVVKSESEPLLVMTSPPVDDPAPESSSSSGSVNADEDSQAAEPSSAPVMAQVEKSATIDCLSRLSPFEELRITAATTTCEAYDPSKRYTLYKITYLTRCCSMTAAGEDNQQQRYQVNRRYREFVNLHERLLACDPLVKKSMKNIKGPSRSLPIGSNMDRDYVERRRIFLQDYLQNLCGIALVAHQPDFCQFLAYNYDPRIEFVGKKPNEFIPRFDRMFMSAVSEIRDLFHTTTTTSNDDQQQQGNNSSGGGSGVKRSGEVVEKIRKMVLGSRNKTEEHFRSVRRSFAGFNSPRSADNSHHSVTPHNWIRPDLLLPPPPPATAKVDPTVAPSSNDEAVDEQHLQIAACVCEALGEIWGVGLGERSVIYLMFGRYLDSFVLDKIASLTTPQRWLSYLQTLESLLWPDGKWNSGDDGKTKKRKETKRGSCKEEAVRTMREFFPRSLVAKLMADGGSYEAGVRDLVESFQNPTINRHLVYHIIDSLASLLFPDLTSLVAERDNIAM